MMKERLEEAREKIDLLREEIKLGAKLELLRRGREITVTFEEVGLKNGFEEVLEKLQKAGIRAKHIDTPPFMGLYLPEYERFVNFDNRTLDFWPKEDLLSNLREKLARTQEEIRFIKGK